MKHAVLVAILLVLVGTFFVLLRAVRLRTGAVEPPQERVCYRLNDSLRNDHSALAATQKMERQITRWMNRNNIRGASLAIMKDERLIYGKGFGWADKEAEEPAETGSLYRIASASKLITAVGIMKLCDKGLLRLDDRVFGPDGILCDSVFLDIRDRRATKITVRQLLNHTSGFSRRMGDPMFRAADIIEWEELDHAPSTDELIAFQLRQRLRDVPGGSAQYSNVGYLVLSRIVEKVSGVDYETFMQREVLRPAGCYDMHIARNYYEERYAGEVKYYGHAPEDSIPSYDGSGRMRLREYGGNNITGLQGAGAWVCSAVELLRLVASVDGRPGVPDVLSPKSVAEMKRLARKGDFALGWSRYEPKTGRLIRTGTMSGTCAYVELLPDGLSYVLITNTSNYRGASFTNSIGRTIRDAMARVEAWPEDRDLFVAVPPLPVCP